MNRSMKSRFEFGASVWFKAYVTFSSFGGSRRMKRHEELLTGRIIGVVRRYEGSIHYEGEEEGVCFAASKTHVLWRVATSMTGRPFEVLDEDVDTNFTEPAVQIPWSPPWPNTPAHDKARKMLREEMATWPRDASGRWFPTKKTEK